MQKLKFIKSVFALILIFLSGILIATSCEHRSSSEKQTSLDSTEIAEVFAEIQNPTFTSVEEVLVYQDGLTTQHGIETEFENLSSSTLTNVSKVLLYKYGITTKKDIVLEYLARKDIYDSLSEQPDSSNTIDSADVNPKTDEEDLQTTEEIIQGTVDNSYNSKDTVINGKHAKVLTIKQITYE